MPVRKSQLYEGPSVCWIAATEGPKLTLYSYHCDRVSGTITLTRAVTTANKATDGNGDTIMGSACQQCQYDGLYLLGQDGEVLYHNPTLIGSVDGVVLARPAEEILARGLYEESLPIATEQNPTPRT